MVLSVAILCIIFLYVRYKFISLFHSLSVEEKEVAGNDVENGQEGMQVPSRTVDGSIVVSKRPPDCFTEGMTRMCFKH